MELTQLKYFMTLYDTLNFTEAARQSFITQSSLSLSIRHLETEIGEPLFSRIGKRTFPTEAGDCLARHARRVLAEANSAVCELKELHGALDSKMRIGVVYSLCDVLNDSMLKFTAFHPETRISVVERNSVSDIVSLLLNGKADFALTYRPENLQPQLECVPLFDAPLCVIVHSDHPLARFHAVPLDVLPNYPVVTFPHGIHTREVIDQMFQNNAVNPLQPNIEVSDAGLILRMVETGHWFTILAGGVVSMRQTLRTIPIEGQTEKLQGCLLRVRGGYLSQRQSAFFNLLRGRFSLA